MHREDVVRRDGLRGWRDLASHRVGLDTEWVGQELQRRAAAVRTFNLDEGQIFTPSQEADPVAGDGLVADGAEQPVRERAKWVAGIHPRGV